MFLLSRFVCLQSVGESGEEEVRLVRRHASELADTGPCGLLCHLVWTMCPDGRCVGGASLQGEHLFKDVQSSDTLESVNCVQDVAPKIKGKMAVVKINTEKYSNLAAKYSVQGLPTVRCPSQHGAKITACVCLSCIFTTKAFSSWGCLRMAS